MATDRADERWKLNGVQQVVVRPATTALVSCQSAALVATVTGEAGADTSVRWESSDTNAVTVDASGLVKGWASGSATVTATSVANPAVRGTASVSVFPLGVGNVSIVAITQAGTGQPVNLQALTDSVDVSIVIAQPPCHHVPFNWTQLAVRFAGARDTLDKVVQLPPSTTSQKNVVRVNTAARKADGTPVLPNGTYKVIAIVVGSDGTTDDISQAVTIANP